MKPSASHVLIIAVGILFHSATVCCGTIAADYKITYTANVDHLPILNLSAPGCDAALRRGNLPPIPDTNGVAGAFAGISGDAILAAGGANFPNGKPWENGKKLWHDTIWALPQGATDWTTVSMLSRPIAYGVSATIPEGVLCIGGDDTEHVLSDVFVMKWVSGRVVTEKYPSLPTPLTFAAGATLGNSVYVIGGVGQTTATEAARTFLQLDLAKRDEGWKPLEPWPGAGRIFPVTAVSNGKLYLCSGAELSVGPETKPTRKYLRDAYCYSPGNGWARIAEMPRAAVAAPSPCQSTSQGFRILSGDDGSLAGTKPWPGHPGFAKSILCYDAAANTWSENPSAAFPATAPVVPLANAFAIISGELRPGVRTPDVELIQ